MCNCVECTGDANDYLDLDRRYRVEGYGGVAWRVLGYVTEWTEEEWVYDGEGDPEDESSYLYNEPEQVENRERVRAVMVGDDSVHTFGVDEIEPLADDEYCPECGQIGCKAYPA